MVRLLRNDFLSTNGGGSLAGPTFTFEDDRFHYAEQRFVTLGLLKGVCVSLVHTEAPDRIHIISFRKATKNEQIIFFQSI